MDSNNIIPSVGGTPNPNPNPNPDPSQSLNPNPNQPISQPLDQAIGQPTFQQAPQSIQGQPITQPMMNTSNNNQGSKKKTGIIIGCSLGV